MEYFSASNIFAPVFRQIVVFTFTEQETSWIDNTKTSDISDLLTDQILSYEFFLVVNSWSNVTPWF